MKDKSPGRDPRISNIDMVQIVPEKGGAKRIERIENVSRSGLFVRTDSPLPLKARVKLVFSIVKEDPDGETKIAPVSVKGEVVRHTEGGEKEISGPGMGIRFIDIDPKTQTFIDEIVNRTFEITPTEA